MPLLCKYSPTFQNTVDRKIFTLKIICIKKFRVVKFSRFRSIHKIFITVDDCNMDECLESFWRLVYYQVSGKPGIARCSHWSDIYFGECGLTYKLIHWSSPCNFNFCVFHFHSCSRVRNYFNSKIFPIYGSTALTICTGMLFIQHCYSKLL